MGKRTGKERFLSIKHFSSPVLNFNYILGVLIFSRDIYWVPLGDRECAGKSFLKSTLILWWKLNILGFPGFRGSALKSNVILMCLTVYTSWHFFCYSFLKCFLVLYFCCLDNNVLWTLFSSRAYFVFYMALWICVAMSFSRFGIFFLLSFLWADFYTISFDLNSFWYHKDLLS